MYIFFIIIRFIVCGRGVSSDYDCLKIIGGIYGNVGFVVKCVIVKDIDMKMRNWGVCSEN